MAVYTTAGSTFAIATGASANSSPANSAAYIALTWTNVGEWENGGEFGDSASVVSFTSIADSRVRKRKGSRNAGTMELTFGFDALDAGQIALRAAVDSQFRFNFRIQLNDQADANDTDSFFYFGAYVMKATVVPGGADDITKMNVTLEIDTAITTVAATVVP